MIVEQRTDRQMQTNVEGESIAMTVDKANMGHVMYLLRNAYSDSEYACIREYATNARDAHIEAGVTRPIEVTTPNTFSPFLRIKDYGVGLDANDIREIYSQYGTSTKRSSNDFNGALGIGCKSALAYSQQFTVIATKDGRQLTVSVALDNEGVGTMTPVSDEPTDEPNGVEVMIPVKAQNQMAEKAEKFFRAWEPGTVLLNGKEPKPFDGLKVGDNMLVREGTGEGDIVVMGNVPYPVEQGKIAHGLAKGGFRTPNYSLVVFVKIGEVAFPPSREALDYEHPRTQTTLQTIAQEFKANVNSAIQDQMNKCATAGEAIEVMTKYHNMVPNLANHTYTYKRKTVPAKIEPDGGLTLVPITGYYGNSSSEQNSLAASFFPKTLFVSGYNLAKFTGQHKDKLMHYLNNGSGITPVDKITHIALMETIPTLDWIDDNQRVDWDTIRAINLSPAVPGVAKTRIPGSYDVVDVVNRYPKQKKGDDLDLTKPLYHAVGGKYSGQRYRELICHFKPDATIVSMGRNRKEKFERLVPQSVECRYGVDKLYKEWIESIGKKDAEALAISDAGATSDLKALDPKRVKDPKVKAAIAIAQRDLTKLQKERKLFRNIGYRADNRTDWSNPLDAYPLFDGYYDIQRHPDDVYIYMNAAYAARKEG